MGRTAERKERWEIEESLPMETMNANGNATVIDAVFVYGTLKRGQCRAVHWPSQPLSIQGAWVRGNLYDRWDYPAMTPGDDRIRGELWRFPVEDMPGILETLDRVEGTNQPGEPDQYVRVVVEVADTQGQFLARAHTYLYATDPLLDGFRRIRPNGEDADVAWPPTALP